MNKPHRQPLIPRLPDWKLERFLLGELPPSELREIQAQMDSRPDLAARAQALREERSEILAAHPVEHMAGAIGFRLQQGKGRPAGPRASGSGRRGWAGAFSFPPWSQAKAWAPAFGMILVLALLPFTPYSPFPSSSGAGPGQEAGGQGAARETGTEATRIKGLEPRLILYRKTGGGPQKLLSGETARSGDLVQVHYESAGRSFGALFSLDAEGKVTRHLPERGNRSVTLRSGGPVPLDFAYELDDAAGWERFYLITSDRPFALDTVEEALKRNFLTGAAGNGAEDSLALPKGLGQSKFILLKESGT